MGTQIKQDIKVSEKLIEPLFGIFTKDGLYEFYKENNIDSVPKKIGVLEKILRVEGYSNEVLRIGPETIYTNLENEFLGGEWRLFYAQGKWQK